MERWEEGSSELSRNARNPEELSLSCQRWQDSPVVPTGALQRVIWPQPWVTGC